MPLGLWFSLSEDLLHAFKVILKVQGFLKPLFKGFWGGVAAENLLLEGEGKGLSEEVREGSRDVDLGLGYQDPEFGDVFVHQLLARHP